ncbi:VOC family protein [Shinella sp.]|uniref:VOC family protein n=1 Tax=Shinella sp. TaxID=1870904 RepID=UPI00301BFD7F
MPLFSPAPDVSSPFASMGGDHVGVRVADYDAAVAWYKEKLDFRLMGKTEASGVIWAFLAPPNDDRFMIELAAGPGAQDRATPKDLHGTLGLHGWHHLCFRVDSVDDTLEELRRRGVPTLAGPMEVAEINRRFAFFADPWGNVIELTQPIAE